MRTSLMVAPRDWDRQIQSPSPDTNQALLIPFPSFGSFVPLLRLRAKEFPRGSIKDWDVPLQSPRISYGPVLVKDVTSLCFYRIMPKLPTFCQNIFYSCFLQQSTWLLQMAVVNLSAILFKNTKKHGRQTPHSQCRTR